MDRILNALRAAGEPTRIRLLALLARSELTVSELTHILGQSQPRVSRHLKLLADAGLVERFREGNWVFYSMTRARIHPGSGRSALRKPAPDPAVARPWSGSGSDHAVLTPGVLTPGVLTSGVLTSGVLKSGLGAQAQVSGPHAVGAGAGLAGAPQPGDLNALAGLLVTLLPDDDPVLLGDAERLDAVRRERADAAAAYFRGNADRWGRIQALHLPEEEIEQALLDLLGPEKIGHHVDLGTGTGRILELVGARADEALGIDYSHEMLALARANLQQADLPQAQVRHGDIFALGLPPGSADLVTIHQVLHFLADPGRAVEEAARILAPDGRIVVIDFAPHGLEVLREEHAHRRLGFSDGEVAGWFAASGLSLELVRRLPEDKNAPESEPNDDQRETGEHRATGDRAPDGQAGPAARGGGPGPELTVCLWLARKAGSQAQTPAPTGTALEPQNIAQTVSIKEMPS